MGAVKNNAGVARMGGCGWRLRSEWVDVGDHDVHGRKTVIVRGGWAVVEIKMGVEDHDFVCVDKNGAKDEEQ